MNIVNKLFVRILYAVEHAYGDNHPYGALSFFGSILWLSAGMVGTVFLAIEGVSHAPLMVLCAASLFLIFPILFIIDLCIAALIDHITDGDHRPRYYTISRIIGVEGETIYNDADDHVAAALHTFNIFALIAACLMMLFLVIPNGWIIGFTIATAVGIVEGTRFAYKTSRALKTHVVDRDAHKRK